MLINSDRLLWTQATQPKKVISLINNQEGSHNEQEDNEQGRIKKRI